MKTQLRQHLIKYEKIIGSVASTLAIIMFASLIEVLVSNVRGASHIFIQPTATAFNGFFWSLYAYGRKDWFLMVPNIIACILGVLTGASAFF